MSEVLDSRQLQAFVALAQHRSATRAARELHLTPSAVSHSIRSLEDQLGCRLFDRVGKTMTLTLCGERLLTYAQRILADMNAARQELEELTRWGRGRLRLMASPTACQYLLPPMLRAFKERFPEYNLSVEAGDTPAVVTALLDHRIDLALGLRPPPTTAVLFRPLFEDSLLFIVSRSHPWAVRARVERAEISQQPLILYSKSSLTYRLIEEYFHREGLRLTTVMELGSMEATKELVKLGLGITIMAPWAARKELEEGSLVALPLGRRLLTRCWGVLVAQGKSLTLAEETWIQICSSVCRDLKVVPPTVSSSSV
ncbi:MAG: LysR family transcriptional regulator [Verrucomicrobiota bacterium]|nr:LysR family transcriptional regulator [Limisphaera sp.]MDW8381943.1 LysR family transcriptional regulator [Verrucomicrobiota bacterium]